MARLTKKRRQEMVLTLFVQLRQLAEVDLDAARYVAKLLGFKHALIEIDAAQHRLNELMLTLQRAGRWKESGQELPRVKRQRFKALPGEA